jgi:hypothetical protein
MKRFLLTFLVLAVSAGPALAQVRGGSISGAVKDQQGGVLPGASITAQGADVTLAITTIGDGTFHLLDLAPGSYTITAALTGFTTVVRENVIVAVGRNVDLAVQLNVAGQVETVNVNAAAPIIDIKATGTATNFTLDELRSIPTSRDPFALVRTVPGVLVDQVNVGGNLTGTQPLVMAKGTRQQDTSLTLDGVEITDMGAPGQSPTYFNFDNFEEVHVSTAGNAITARTGAASLNFIVKRGTNQFHGGLRGYYSNDGLESSNVPIELKLLATPITAETADHSEQISDFGFDLGGPVWRDRAWFYGSYSKQDIRVFKRSTRAVDKTVLNNPNFKLNVQATKNDLVNFLFFNGYKIKDGRSNPANATTFEEFAATHHQDNAYSGNPLHGLFKIGNDRVMSSNMFLSAKYAYYNTGIQLTPEGGMDAQAGRNINQSRAYGSTVQSLQVRPQHSVTVDVNNFFRALGASHDLKLGVGFRRVLNQVKVEWPGNGILAIEQTGTTAATSARAQVFRQSQGANLLKYVDVYIGDSISMNRVTVDLGVRYDRQWGEALAATTDGSKAFPSLIPGVVFPGYEAPFVWKNVSPRVGLTYLVDAAGKTVARASFSRFAGQLAASTVGVRNPSTGSTPGNAVYPWTDLNGDHFAQESEVDITATAISSGGGFNAANPTALASSPSQIDPNLKAPVTQSVLFGVERELAPNLALMVDYSYNRTSNLFGNLSANITPRVGVTLDDYSPFSVVTGTLPDGQEYSVQTYAATPAKFAASGGGFYTTNVPGYHTDYKGLEVNVVKRLSNRWMGRLGMAFSSTTENFDDPKGVYDTNGNPTPTAAEPLQDGGQFAPTPSVSGGIFMNARWQFNANAMYVAPYGIEVAASVFGRQGYPFPIYRAVTVGATGTTENLNVLISPKIDTFRLDNVWNTDIRLARSFEVQTRRQPLNIRFVADVFNVFNANTELTRVNLMTNANGTANASFNTLVSNVSPRIFRVGLVVGF